MTVPLWYKIYIYIYNLVEKQQILIQKTLEVLSLLRPIVHDTSKTAIITWFILVLYWAMDVIYDFCYIQGPMEYWNKPSGFCCFRCVMNNGP